MSQRSDVRQGFVRLWCLITLCVATSLTSVAQKCDEPAREIARSVVLSATERSTTTYLSIHRREDLEDLFYSLASHDVVGPSREVRIFRVSTEGYEVREGRTHYHFSPHGPLVYLVAVDRSSKQAFRLRGFKDSHEEFNRLAATYRIQILSTLQAQEYS
ncbi:MAG: hypothetical protein ACRD2L_17180, partial [Terriglobia bacterium]